MEFTKKQVDGYVELAKRTLQENPGLEEKYAPLGRKYLATIEVLIKEEEPNEKEAAAYSGS